MKLATLLVALITTLHAAPALILHHGKVITVDKNFRIAINANGRINASPVAKGVPIPQNDMWKTKRCCVYKQPWTRS